MPASGTRIRSIETGAIIMSIGCIVIVSIDDERAQAEIRWVDGDESDTLKGIDQIRVKAFCKR